MVYLPYHKAAPGMARDLPLNGDICASTARFVGLAQAQATAGVMTPGRQRANQADNPGATDDQPNVGLATARPGSVCHGCAARPSVGGEDASADRRKGEMEMSRKNMWMMLGLGVMLAVSGVARGAA